jgi:polysaccharide export outer membrane protein
MRTARLNVAIAGLCALAAGLPYTPRALGQSAPQVQSTMTSTQSSGSGASGSPSSGTGGIQLIPEDFSKLKIAPGFLLDIRFYDEPDLATTGRVNRDGDIVLPLAGSIHADKLTANELEREIETRYRAQEILNAPQVTVNILEYSSGWITVNGEVNRPGRLQLLAPHTLIDVLASVGGETAFASSDIDIHHGADPSDKQELIRYARDSSPAAIMNVMVDPGDTVVVHRAGIVYVLGGVLRPGGYLLQEDGNLSADQAIAMAQGLLPEAKVHTAWVIRRRPDGTELVIPYDYRRSIQGKRAGVPLHSQDILYVDLSKPKEIYTKLSGIINSASSAAIYVYHPGTN